MARKKVDNNGNVPLESWYWLYEKRKEGKYYMIYTEEPDIKKEIHSKPFCYYEQKIPAVQYRVKEGTTDYLKLMKLPNIQEYKLANLQRKEGKP